VPWRENLEGEVALVTGAAEGVGAVVARALAEAGADVSVNHLRQPDAAAETCAAVVACGRRAIAVDADISSPARCRELVATTVDQLGRLDLLIHNASSFVSGPFLELTEDDFERSFGVIVRGPFFLSQAAAPVMLQQGSGKIVAILGNSLWEAQPDLVSHTVAKVALARLMEALAVALSPNVQCLGVAPDRLLDTGGAEDVATLIVELCRSSAFLNGAIVPLDGARSKYQAS
jgi:NAD(P)-dependent dehydrogenase (short-subunit alcohol dehydrogenase family)